MTAQDRNLEQIVSAIESGETLVINAMGARFRVKRTYKIWKELGRDMFRTNKTGIGPGVSIRSGNTWGTITDVKIV